MMPNYEGLIKKNDSALIIWDVQEVLVSRIFNKEEFLGKVANLISAARELDIPVLYTKITPLPERFESPLRKATGRAGFNPGEIQKEVYPKDSDVVINKNTPSIFVGTNFEMMMRNAGITTLLFAGISTEIGIESSARHAQNLGFLPVVIEDAVSSADQEAHDRSLKNMSRMMPVMKSDSLIKILKT
jgi:nicotinamidase-related amidase